MPRYIIQITVARLNPDDGGPVEPTPVDGWDTEFSDSDLDFMSALAEGEMRRLNKLLANQQDRFPDNIQPYKEPETQPAQ